MATTDDGGQPVLLLKCDGDTALNRDAYMRNVAAASSSGWTWGKVEQYSLPTRALHRAIQRLRRLRELRGATGAEAAAEIAQAR
jgi:hypothetical protein